MSALQDPRRRLPAVGRVLEQPSFRSLEKVYGRRLVRVQVQRRLEQLRTDRSLASEAPVSEEQRMAQIVSQVEADLESLLGSSLRRVLNATGIFLHTNLGRAPLPQEVADAFPALLTASCDLEIDLESGRRGDRNERVEKLLCGLVEAPAAVVVNNNAAALVLALAALARDREVLVSRGELVEIGGSFRIPAILEAAGARLVEVGSTNRTRLRDYEAAIAEDTALLLKVHTSNYRIRGFTESVAAAQLVELGRRRGVRVLVDEGSGLLAPHPAPQLSDHASLQELVACGCDLVCGSGDKLLGGPQAGLLLGVRDAVDLCRSHPLYRAMRPSRGTFIALEPTLRRHLAGDPLPIDQLWVDAARHRERLETVAAAIGAELVPADAFVGGGAAPDAPIPGEALALEGREADLRRLRLGDPPVVGYLKEDRLVLDLRTVDPTEDDALIAAVLALGQPTVST